MHRKDTFVLKKVGRGHLPAQSCHCRVTVTDKIEIQEKIGMESYVKEKKI